MTVIVEKIGKLPRNQSILSNIYVHCLKNPSFNINISFNFSSMTYPVCAGGKEFLLEPILETNLFCL